MHSNNYRHEFKYPVSESEIEIIKNRICNLMDLDVNAGTEGQ